VTAFISKPCYMYMQLVQLDSCIRHLTGCYYSSRPARQSIIQSRAPDWLQSHNPWLQQIFTLSPVCLASKRLLDLYAGCCNDEQPSGIITTSIAQCMFCCFAGIPSPTAFLATTVVQMISRGHHDSCHSGQLTGITNTTGLRPE